MVGYYSVRLALSRGITSLQVNECELAHAALGEDQSAVPYRHHIAYHTHGMPPRTKLLQQISGATVGCYLGGATPAVFTTEAP
jgi:hypothetical protein